MPKKLPSLSSKYYQKGASNLLIGALVVAIAFIGFLYLKSRGIVSIPTTISNVASSINQTVNPFSSDYSGYGVQISASHYLDDAKKVMNKFADAGYSAFVVSSQIRGSTIYQVRLGPYETREEANTIKNRIKRRFKRSSYVRKSFVVYRD
ncbi:MAG TPA: SPOR domain-containing protein [Leucothrix mucor]|nr:SPOR domain-containing protein [Leucothrix mucor]